MKENKKKECYIHGAVVEPETDGRGEFVTGTPARSHGLGGESIFLYNMQFHEI